MDQSILKSVKRRQKLLYIHNFLYNTVEKGPRQNGTVLWRDPSELWDALRESSMLCLQAKEKSEHQVCYQHSLKASIC